MKKTNSFIYKIVIGILVVFILWFIITIFLLPLINIIQKSFFINGMFSFDNIKEVFSSSRVQRSLINTLIISLATIITVNIFSIFKILITEYYHLKFSRILKLAYCVPFIYRGIAMVRGYDFIYSSDGIITKTITNIFPNADPYWFQGFIAILIVHTFSLGVFHFLFGSNAVKSIDYNMIETAQSLGASNRKILTKIILPLIKPTLLFTTILVFISSLTSVAAPEILGKGFHMISPTIRNLNSIGFQDMSAVLSMVLGLVSLLLLLIFKFFENKSKYYSVGKVATKMKKIPIKNKKNYIIITIIAWFIFLIYMFPVVINIIYSFTDIQTISTKSLPNFLNFDNYIRVFSTESILNPLINTFRISIIAVVISLVIGVTVAIINKNKNKYAVFLEYPLLIPWLFPPLSLSLGLIIAYNTPQLITFNLISIGSYLILPVAYTFYIIYMIMYAVKANLKTINNNILESACSLGSNEVKTFFLITLPIILPTILAVTAIAFNSLLLEFTVSELLYITQNRPLSITYISEFSNYNPYGSANILVYTVIIMIISMLILFFTRRFNKLDKQSNNM